MNIQNLTTAISEHIGHNRVQYLNESSFILNNEVLKINTGLLKNRRFSFRFNNTKSLLLSLRDEGIFPVTDKTIDHVLNKYRKLSGSINNLNTNTL